MAKIVGMPGPTGGGTIPVGRSARRARIIGDVYATWVAQQVVKARSEHEMSGDLSPDGSPLTCYSCHLAGTSSRGVFPNASSRASASRDPIDDPREGHIAARSLGAIVREERVGVLRANGEAGIDNTIRLMQMTTGKGFALVVCSATLAAAAVSGRLWFVAISVLVTLVVYWLAESSNGIAGAGWMVCLSSQRVARVAPHDAGSGECGVRPDHGGTQEPAALTAARGQLSESRSPRHRGRRRPCGRDS
jgi:hypothetical protein